jgi:predicted nucleic-acid-binding protein
LSLEDIVLSEVKQGTERQSERSPLYVESKIVVLVRKQVEQWLQEAVEAGGESLVNRHKVSVR